MKDIVSLRNHLFDQLNRLADATTEDIEMEINRASSIVQVSEAIIKSAQVENQFIAITKGYGSGFIPVINDKKSLLEIVKEKLDEPRYEREMFDVDKENNWLNTDHG